MIASPPYRYSISIQGKQGDGKERERGFSICVLQIQLLLYLDDQVGIYNAPFASAISTPSSPPQIWHWSTGTESSKDSREKTWIESIIIN
jgi:hypothetical protein